MDPTLSEVLIALDRSGDKINEILRLADSSALRAPRLAEMLRSFWPSSPLYACLLEEKNGSPLCVLDGSGKLRSEWDDPVRVALNQRGKGGARKPADLITLPKTLKLSGFSLLLEEIISRPLAVPKDVSSLNRAWFANLTSFANWGLGTKGDQENGGEGGHRWGVLALAVPRNAPAEALAVGRILLTVCGEQLAARLHSKAQEDALHLLQRELDGQSWLANTGELSGPLTHEFNNFLNIVLLHVALLEAEIPEKLRPELLELRRQGASITSLVKQFQQYRRRLQLIQNEIDVNRVVLDAVRILTGPQSEPAGELVIKLPPSSKIESAGLGRPIAVPVKLALAPSLPPVLGSAADLRRLCIFLLTNAAAAGQAAGSITIRTEAADRNVLLRVEDTGPSIPVELLAQCFEPTTVGRAGTNSLELAACETLVRRLQGKIRCENRPEGGVVVIVALPGCSVSPRSVS
jgi:signal transduction histidine kinase